MSPRAAVALSSARDPRAAGRGASCRCGRCTTSASAPSRSGDTPSTATRPSSESRNVRAASTSGAVSTPVFPIGNRPGTTTPSVVMPTNRSATRASPNVSRSSSRPGEVWLVPSGQWRHAAEPELFVVDERHSAAILSARRATAPRRARQPLARTSLRRCSPSRTRSRAWRPSRAASTSPTAVPHGKPRAAVAASSLSVRPWQLGRARWQPARQREVSGAEEHRVEVRDIEDRRPSAARAPTSSSCTPRIVSWPRAR